MDKLNVTFYPNMLKKSSKTGKIPIYMRLFGAGKLETRLDKIYDLDPSEISSWNEFNPRLDLKNSSTNFYLEKIGERFRAVKNEFLLYGVSRSIDEVKDLLVNKIETKKSQEITLIEYAQKYLQEEVENCKEKEEGTKKNYRNAINQLCTYLEYKNLKACNLKEFDFTLADGFKKYLEMDIPSLPYKKINGEVSSSTKIKNVKPIFEKAINEKIISKNPFDKMKLVFETEALAYSFSSEQLESIYKLDVSKNSNLKFTKDFILFMCFTGLSYGDAMSFSKDYLSKRNDNRWLYDTSRRKTGMRVKQVLTKQAQEIVEKYLNIGYSIPGNKIFPQETGESINRKMKILAAAAGIVQNVSTKTGRHSCSNLIDEAGLEERLMVHSFMGWSNGKDIRRRYLTIGYEKLLRFSERLELYIEENLK